MHRGQKIIETLRRRRIIEPDRDDVEIKLQRSLHFTQNVRRDVGMLAVNQDETARVLDGIQDRLRIRAARGDVPRRHPAGDPRLFERLHDQLGGGCILVRMTYKNVVAHALALDQTEQDGRVFGIEPHATV